MRRALFAPVLFALAACDSGGGNQQATATQIDDVQNVKGTITDEAINLDRAVDEAPIEIAPVTTTALPDDKPQPKPDSAKAADTEESGEAEITKAEPAEEAE